jgi:hypothetical protein
MEQINNMRLHQTIDAGEGYPDYMTKVTRVPGGLMYEKVSLVTGAVFSNFFVPYTDFNN